jgi:hypothetical protein
VDWQTVTQIVFGSSVLGAVLNNAVASWLKSLESSRKSKYLALNLAYVFEGFAYGCLSAIEDHDLAEASEQNLGQHIMRVPEFPQLPEFDYQVLDLAILDTVLDFPQCVSFANEGTSFLFEVADDYDAMMDAYKSSVKLAIDALCIGDMIRKRYGLTKRSLKFGSYSVRDRLNGKLTYLKEKELKYLEKERSRCLKEKEEELSSLEE